MPYVIPPGPIFVDCNISADQSKPLDDRILWHARVLNGREAIAYDQRLTAIMAIDDPAKLAAALNAIIRYAGEWRNVTDAAGAAVAMTDDQLDLLSVQERYVLAKQLPAAAGYTAVRKGLPGGHSQDAPLPPLPE